MNVLVVGLGNPDRGDDAVGPAVARAAAAAGVEAVCVEDPTALVNLWAGRGHVVVVDAVRTGARPGTVHLLEAGAETLPARAWRDSGRAGTHGFGLAAAVELSRALGRLPRRVTVVGVEAASAAHGAPLSPPVAAAVDEAVRTVRRLAAPARARRRYDVRGVVQGVGFRPFVYATAAELGLAGTVRNTGAGVVVEAEGEPAALDELARRLRERPPPMARVEDVRTRALAPRGGTGFTIEASQGAAGARTFASPDIAICADCLRELGDPGDRRYRHPFITCTNCGPRFTIITDLPYDRATTTMAGFGLCEDCRREYDDPADRRFHAQPVCCPRCGPRLRLDGPGQPHVTGEKALAEARRLLAEGRVVAVKGLGGWHLACDARAEAAVASLRRRKRRGDKPFAVMAASLDVARSLVALGDDEARLLTDRRRPIVLLPRHPAGGAGLAPSVAPGNPDLGVMLPYTPLHVLLLGLPGDPPGPDVLVMTSGNLAGEPIVTGDDEAHDRLAGLADAWLGHDRRIHVPCDDSVVRVVGGAELPVRRSRGWAPLPLALPFEVTPVLATGADLKNTCAVAAGRYAWLSQHVGDLADVSGLDVLTRTAGHLEALTGVRPASLVADLHPGYRSTAWAREHAAGRPVALVQHHQAHVAAVMGEHGLGLDDRVVGVAFDGTGYGLDGAVWGGEVLVGGYAELTRFAHLAPVPLPGGDAAVERPYRMALAHLHAARLPWDADLPAVRACPERERRVLAHQLVTGLGCVPTTSMGRLFDTVASLAGVRHVADFEAQAAVELEALARGVDPQGGYRFALARGVADPAPVLRAVVADLRAGVPAATVAARFHAAVTALVLDLAGAARAATGLRRVVLGGGVFQNALLLDAVRTRLADAGFEPLAPRLLPPNDGGLALGQLLVAAARTRREDQPCA